MEELRFATNDLELVVLPGLGGRLYRLRAFGIDVLRTPADPQVHARDPFYWGAYPMLPWCGRVGIDPLTVAGRVITLPANHPDGWAIHGQAYAAPWEVVDQQTLRFQGGGSGWPWAYEAEMSFDVGAAHVGVGLSLTNSDETPMPAGVGLHPWLRSPVVLRVPADLAYDDNTKSSPRPRPVAGPTDLREPAELAVGVDTTWTGLTDRRVAFHWPDISLRAEMEAHTDGNLVFVGARLAEISDAIAVEPQTHAPQGLRRLVRGEPDPMVILQPGETLRLQVSLRFWR